MTVSGTAKRPRHGEVALASGLPIATHTSIERLVRTDIIIVPSLLVTLIARHASPAAAHATARFYAPQWQQKGLAPYVVFDPPTDHGDAIVAAAQIWLAGHYTLRSSLKSAIERAGLPERSFKRRFTNATSFSPIVYVQRLRVKHAKLELETSAQSADEISWHVGYDDPAFFRKLFMRTTGMTPAAYRRKFRVPEFVAG